MTLNDNDRNVSVDFALSSIVYHSFAQDNQQEDNIPKKTYYFKVYSEFQITYMKTGSIEFVCEFKMCRLR